MIIRPYEKSDAFQITQLFHSSVHAIADTLYTKEEKEAWAPTPPDYSSWEQRLDLKQPFVGSINRVIVGFIELESDGHIDCFYVHKDYQQKGIGGQLLQHAIEQGVKRKQVSFYIEASFAAKPLFEKFGFVVKRSNIIKIRGQNLKNYTMTLRIKTDYRSGIF